MDFFLGHSGSDQAYFDEFLDDTHLITVATVMLYRFLNVLWCILDGTAPSSYDPPSLVHKSTYPRAFNFYHRAKVFFVQCRTFITVISDNRYPIMTLNAWHTTWCVFVIHCQTSVVILLHNLFGVCILSDDMHVIFIVI